MKLDGPVCEVEQRRQSHSIILKNEKVPVCGERCPTARCLLNGKKLGGRLFLEANSGTIPAGVGETDLVDGRVAQSDPVASSGTNGVGASVKFEGELRIAAAARFLPTPMG